MKNDDISHVPSGYSATQYPAQLDVKIDNGVILVGSDAHVWPGKPSTAMRAFILFCREYKPKAVVMNGDVLDFPRISRHPRIGWANCPLPHEEIETAQDQLHQIEQAASKASKFWTMGNHDLRFEGVLSNLTKDYYKIKGTQLVDHFPNWHFSWSLNLNNTVRIQHRIKGGLHAPINSTLWAGRTTVTGHLHSQALYSITDLNGTRWGVDSGCMADVDHAAFADYSENKPKNHRSGFCMLTFVKGELLPPELITVWGDSQVVFRGQVIRV